MSYNGAGSAIALVFGFGRNRIGRVRVILAGLVIAFAAAVAVPAAASAAITASPAESYQTRGATPIEIEILASDTNPGTLDYTLTSSDHGGTLGAFTDTGSGATAEFTPGDGFGGVEKLHIQVENTDTLESTNVDVTINVVPVARFLTGPGIDDQALTNTATPTFTFDATTGPGEGTVAGTTFSCRVDGVPKGACDSGTFTTASLADGPHTFSVRATSPIGTNDQFVSTSFTIDTVDPAPPTLDGPSGLTNNPDASWSFTVDEGVALCRLITPGDPDPAWDVCPGPTADYTGLPDGTYTFEVRTKDDARNLSTVESKTLEVDTVVDVTIDAAPADGNLDARPSIEFSSTEDPAVTYECRTYEDAAAPEEVPDFAACTSPYVTPFLDKNVTYRFDVRATDPAGNHADASHTWEQDNTAPAVVEPEETLAAGDTVSLDLGGSDADGDTITYSIVGNVDGGTLGDIDQDTGKVDFTAADDAAGTYLIQYEVTDHRQAGTTGGTATVHVEPQTVFVTTPGSDSNDETKNQTPTWTFESPSGVSTFECNLDSAGWEPCDGGSFTPDSDLAEGQHTLEVRAVAEGLYADQTPASSTITVDITAPDVTIDSTPVSLSNVAAPEFEFSSTDPTATFECDVDGEGFNACESGDAIAAVTDGDHTFTVRPTDPSGNVGTDASYTWEVDLTEPEIEITSGLLEGDWTNLRRPAWDFTESDLNLVPTSTTCVVDSQPVTSDCVGPWQPLSNLNDGNHTLTITAADGAGNVGTLTVNFRVTTITPTAIVDSGPASPSGPSASFSFVSTTNLGSQGRFECRTSLNGGAWTAWDTCSANLTLGPLSSGSRTLQVRAVDSAGNYSTGAAVGSWTWTTIGTAPDTVITNTVINGKSAAFGFNSPGNNLATFECKLDGGNWGACQSPKSYTNLTVGSHTFSVRATNQVGTTDGSPATHTWTVNAANAPDTSIDREPPAKTAATAAELEFSSSDASATFECRLDGGTWAACESPHSLSGLAVGSHTFEVRATSNGATDASPASVTWTVTERKVDPPVCAPVAAKAAKSKAVAGVTVKSSHRRAVPGQKIKLKLAFKAKTKKALKNVTVMSGRNVVATLSPRKPKATVVIGEDTRTNFTVLVKPKKGKAQRTTLPFSLVTCR